MSRIHILNILIILSITALLYSEANSLNILSHPLKHSANKPSTTNQKPVISLTKKTPTTSQKPVKNLTTKTQNINETVLHNVIFQNLLSDKGGNETLDERYKYSKKDNCDTTRKVHEVDPFVIESLRIRANRNDNLGQNIKRERSTKEAMVEETSQSEAHRKLNMIQHVSYANEKNKLFLEEEIRATEDGKSTRNEISDIIPKGTTSADESEKDIEDCF